MIFQSEEEKVRVQSKHIHETIMLYFKNIH